jgi:hypothetical protein
MTGIYLARERFSNHTFATLDSCDYQIQSGANPRALYGTAMLPLNDMRTYAMLSLVLLGAAALLGAEIPGSSATEAAAKFEGTWFGRWDASPTKIEFEFKRTDGLKFDVVYRYQNTRYGSPPKSNQGQAEYDPQSKRLKYRAIEFSWHEDGNRLVAKYTFDTATNYALLKRKPREETKSPEQDQ